LTKRFWEGEKENISFLHNMWGKNVLTKIIEEEEIDQDPAVETEIEETTEGNKSRVRKKRIRKIRFRRSGSRGRRSRSNDRRRSRSDSSPRRERGTPTYSPMRVGSDDEK